MTEFSAAAGRGDSVSGGGAACGLVLADVEGLPRVMLESGCIPEHVFERMDFLWRASNHLRLSSPVVSRAYSDQLRKLCARHEAQPSAGGGPLLPGWISASLCDSCGSVLTPGVNCRVRVRHRSLGSPSVRKAKASKSASKCLNELVMTCLMCGGINTRGGAEREARHKKRARRAGGGGGSGGGKGGHAAGVSSEEETPTGKRRSRVATNLRGNFIPLGGGSLPSTPGGAKTPAKKKKSPRSSPPPVHPPSKGTGSSRRGSATGGGGTSGKARSGGGRGGRSSAGGGGDSSGGVSLAGRGAVTAPTTPARPRPAAAAAAAAAAVAAHAARPQTGGERADRGNGGSGAGAGRQELKHGMEGGSVDGGGGGEGGGGGNVGVPTPALSLLERIRRDAKKKRRQDAAAAAAAAAAIGVTNSQI